MKKSNFVSKSYRKIGVFQAISTKIWRKLMKYWKIRREFCHFWLIFVSIDSLVQFSYSNLNDLAGLSSILIHKFQFQAIKSDGSVMQTTSISMFTLWQACQQQAVAPVHPNPCWNLNSKPFFTPLTCSLRVQNPLSASKPFSHSKKVRLIGFRPWAQSLSIIDHPCGCVVMRRKIRRDGRTTTIADWHLSLALNVKRRRRRRVRRKKKYVDH